MSEIVEQGERIGKELCEKHLTVSQLRKFLSAVNAISNKIQILPELTEDIKNEIQYLRVKLAYQAGRNNSKYLQEELDPKIKNIKTKKDFEDFASLMEAIVAYHKFNGGKE